MRLFHWWGEFVSDGVRVGFRGGRVSVRWGASWFQRWSKLFLEEGRVGFRGGTSYLQR